MPTREDMREIRQLRRELLSKHGIVAGRHRPPPQVSVRRSLRPISASTKKTKLMLIIESAFQTPIEELLTTGEKGVEIARRFNITQVTIIRWKKKLGLPLTRAVTHTGE